MKYSKDYEIQWTEECVADSQEEANRILDRQAEENGCCHSITFIGDLEWEEE